MNKPLSLGIVGAGLIVNNAHLPALRNLPGVRIVWIADRQPEQAARLGAAWKIPAVSLPASPELLPPCDIALLATPVHARAAYLAAFAGQHTAVLCEKPFAQSVAEHQHYCAQFSAERLGVGFQRRLQVQNRLMRELVAAQTFGPLQRIRVQEGGRTTKAGPGGYFLDTQNGRSFGVLADLGSHTLDMIFSTLPPLAVHIRHCDMVIDEGIDRHVRAQFTLSAEQGDVDVDYCVTWLDSMENAAWWEFRHATVKMGLAPGGALQIMRGTSPLAHLDTGAMGARTTAQAFFLQWQSFLAGVGTGTPSEVSAQSAVWVTRTVEALHDEAGRT